MKKMIKELKTSRHVFIDEQHMVVNMTHDKSVKTFDDTVRYLELEVEQLMVARPNEQAHVAESSSRKTSYFKRNRKFFKKNKRSDDASKK